MSEEKHIRFLTNDCGVPKRYAGMTLDDFIVEKLRNGKHEHENVENYAKCVEYLENVAENVDKGIGLFFSGTFGIGKTMLMSIAFDIVLQYIFKKYVVGVNARFLTSARLARLLSYDLTEFEKELREIVLSVPQLLAIDDIGRLALSNNKREFVYVEDVVRERYLDKQVTLITSQGRIEDLENNFSAGLADMFKENMVEINFRCDSVRGL